jgi:hypothetical protein
MIHNVPTSSTLALSFIRQKPHKRVKQATGAFRVITESKMTNPSKFLNIS